LDKRLQKLQTWLTDELGLTLNSIEPASADASFRRYFRAHTNQGVYVVMDAPPELEPVDAFISIGEALIGQGVHAPRVYQHSYSKGFLLLEDLGVTTFFEALNSLQPLATEPQPRSKQVLKNADTLYTSAITALVKLQKGQVEQANYDLPTYSPDKLVEEMALFEEWFTTKHLKIPFSKQQAAVWESTQNKLLQAFSEQPQVWVHRDYHSRNLMVTEQDSPGVIDFQDMVSGPIGYDLASLFKDCYIEWSRADQYHWLEMYRFEAMRQLGLTFNLSTLVRWVDFCGLQRHLKVLGIFCRLNYRDNKPHYLSDLPLVAKYVLEVLPLYPELHEFEESFSSTIEYAIQAPASQ